MSEQERSNATADLLPPDRAPPSGSERCERAVF